MFKNDFSDAFKLRMDGLLHFAVINALLCGVIALLLQDSLQQAVFEVILLAAGFCHWKFGAGKYEYFVLCVLIVGMTGRSFKMLLAIAFSIGTAMMAVTFAASQLGIITDLVYEGGRHSFGIIYCTDCAAHILFLMIIYLFLRLDALKLVEYVALLLVCAIMMLTKAQSERLSAHGRHSGLPPDTEMAQEKSFPRPGLCDELLLYHMRGGDFHHHSGIRQKQQGTAQKAAVLPDPASGDESGSPQGTPFFSFRFHY